MSIGRWRSPPASATCDFAKTELPQAGIVPGATLCKPLPVIAHRLAFPAFLLGSAVLSGGPLLVRLADVGAVQSAFWRLALALPALFLLVRWQDPGGLPRRAGLVAVAAGGALFAADLAVWHLGIQRTTLANATLFANATSFLLPLWMVIANRTLPSRRAAAALTVAAVGTALLMGRSAELSPRHLAGDALSLLAAVFYTGYLLVMARSRSTLGAWQALALCTLSAAVLLLPVALLAPGAFIPGDWTPLLLLALGSQVLGQGLIIWALPQVTAVQGGIGLLIQPLLSAALGWIWFAETLAAVELAGMAAILGALLMVRSERASA